LQRPVQPSELSWRPTKLALVTRPVMAQVSRPVTRTKRPTPQRSADVPVDRRVGMSCGVRDHAPGSCGEFPMRNPPRPHNMIRTADNDHPSPPVTCRNPAPRKLEEVP
jgi:hypothetical protein